MPILVIREGSDAGKQFVLKAGKMVMGRRSACDIQVGDQKSSRNHCELTIENNIVTLADLGSTNGTKYKGEPIVSPVTLNPGESFSIGKTVYELLDETAGEKPEIPDYKINELIGTGGSGRVFKALHIPMDRTVALKILHTKFNKDSRLIERFIREARAAGKLNHPNIIQVHDVSKAGDYHFFSMEFVDGISLRKMIKGKGLPPKQALDIIIQTSRALEYAHRNNVIHRDIKPENILVNRQNVVKLLDLGIAAIGGADPEGNAITGTPHYMSPEQVQGKTVDGQSDIYSLGAVFYETLTGEKPFTGDTVKDILKAHLTEKLPAIQELNDQVPDAMVFVIERMMAKRPSQRYGDAKALIEDLEKLKAGGGTEGTRKIARLNPEESVIQQAVRPKKEAAAARRHRRHEEDTGPQAAVILNKLIFIVIVGMVGLVAYLVLKDQLKDPATYPTETPVETATGDGKTTETTPQTPKPSDTTKPPKETPAGPGYLDPLPVDDVVKDPDPPQPAIDPARLKAFEDLWHRTRNTVEGLPKTSIDARLEELSLILDNPDFPAQFRAEANALLADVKKAGDDAFNDAKTQAKNFEKTSLNQAITVMTSYLGAWKDSRYRDEAESIISTARGKAIAASDKAFRTASRYVKNFNFVKARESVIEIVNLIDGVRDENGVLLSKDVMDIRQKVEKASELAQNWMNEIRSANEQRKIPFVLEVPGSQYKEWKLYSVGVDSDNLVFMNIVPFILKNAAGSEVKIAALNSDEKYQLLMLYLTGKETPQIHERLACLCEFLGLDDQKAFHASEFARLSGN